jgi:hypothetical protein
MIIAALRGVSVSVIQAVISEPGKSEDGMRMNSKIPASFEVKNHK